MRTVDLRIDICTWKPVYKTLLCLYLSLWSNQVIAIGRVVVFQGEGLYVGLTKFKTATHNKTLA